MSYHNSKLVLRLSIVGDKATGKSSLVRSYLGQKDGPEISESAYLHHTNIETTKVSQQILDSNGKNSAVTAWAHGVIILYSVEDRKSFEHCEQYIITTKQLTMKNAAIMLVANKIDSPNRQVTLEEGQKLAVRHSCNYIELSALHDIEQVKSIFYELSHEIIDKRGIKPKYHQRTPMMVRRVFDAFTQRGRSNTSYL